VPNTILLPSNIPGLRRNNFKSTVDVPMSLKLISKLIISNSVHLDEHALAKTSRMTSVLTSIKQSFPLSEINILLSSSQEP
jgi:hypothetical protein